jgi:hypothetical protein
VPRMHARRSAGPIGATVVVIVAVAALLCSVGADARWLAAIGRVIAQRRSIPPGIPFASAGTAHWHNVVVLAELVFYALERTLGDRGLMLAQLLAVGAAMIVLARDSRAGGAAPAGVCAALLLAAFGSVPSLAIAREQLFSLALLPVLVALLRAEARRPSRRIWLVVPLLALWSNLHGAALLGLGIALAYLAASRSRRDPIVALGVAAASALALCLTPALAGTPAYYHGLLTNLAAERGQGMWGPLSLSAPADVLLLAAAIALIVRVRRARPALWEWLVLAALVVLTVQASRNGVWLLLFLVPPAARAIRPKRTWDGLVALAAVGSVVVIAFALVRGPELAGGASPALIARALKLAHSSPVLAEDQIAEQIALAGGRIWMGNPIDAFSRPDQAAYLDWLQGSSAGRRALNASIRVVVVSRGSQAQALMAHAAGFMASGGDASTEIYERRGRATPAQMLIERWRR